MKNCHFEPRRCLALATAPENLREAALIVALSLARQQKIPLDRSLKKRLYPVAKEVSTL